MNQQDIIRSYEQSHYTVDELDRAILRDMREVMLTKGVWELHLEGTFEEIVRPTGSLYIDPDRDREYLDLDREFVEEFTQDLVNILFATHSISLMHDGEQGMTYLYYSV